MKNKYFWYVIIAASLWGTMGVFAKVFADFGLKTLSIVALKVIFSGLLIFIYLFFFKRNLLKIRLKDIWYFIGTGIISMLFFNLCYFAAIRSTSISQATALLYTSPAFVIILSRIIFKEKIWLKKILALVLSLIGCVLVSGIIEGFSANITGLLLGIGSGLGYGLYSIFSKLASSKYHALTIAFYTFAFATLGVVFLVDYKEIYIVIVNIKYFFLTALMCAVCCAIPYIL